MKKRLLAFLLATAMATTMLSACGKVSNSSRVEDEDDDDDKDDDDKDSSSSSVDTTGLQSALNVDLSSLDLFRGDDVCEASWCDFSLLLKAYTDSQTYEDLEAAGIVIPDRTVTEAKDIYDSLDYTEEMFYGTYCTNHTESEYYTHFSIDNPSDGFIDNATWQPASNIFSTNEADYEYSWEMKVLDKEISVLPYAFSAGKGSINQGVEFTSGIQYLVSDTTHHYMKLSYAARDPQNPTDYSTATQIAAYEIEDGKLKINFVSGWSYDEENNSASVRFSDHYEEYDFSFQGIYVTLSNEDGSVTMCSRQFSDYSADSQGTLLALIDGNMADGQVPMDGLIDEIYFTASARKPGEKNYLSLYMYDASGNYAYGGEYAYAMSNTRDSIMRIDEDGLFSLAYADSDGNIHQGKYVWFNCNDDGLILANKDNVYYFMSTYMADSLYHVDDVVFDFGSNISGDDLAAIGNMDQDALQIIFDTRDDLLDDLREAFDREGVDADVDEETGEITLNSEILFGNDEYEVSEDGKVTLAKFIGCFAEVLDKDEYDDFIKDILIQGHTDTNGSYDYNLELSQKRADAVMEYCINDAGLTDDQSANMAMLMISEGCSFDYPIYDEDGNVDMAASRRVTFTFHINVDYRRE